MYIKLKVRTIIVWLVVTLAASGIVYGQWNAQEPDRLVQLIIQSDPTGDHLIDVTPRGYSFSHSSDRTVSYEQALQYALRMLEDYPDHRWSTDHADYILGHLYLKTGDPQQALTWFRRSEQTGEREEAKTWADMLDHREGMDTASLSLSGRVLLNGNPAPGVLVYLQEADATSWRSPGYLHNPSVMTDQDGIYRFYDAVPGTYEVGAALRPEQLEGLVRTNATEEPVVLAGGSPSTFDVRFVPKLETIAPAGGTEIDSDRIRFQWEPYPGAVSYRVNILSFLPDENGEWKGRSSLGLQESWTDTEALYTVAELRGYGERGVHYDRQGPDPASILGIVYPGGRFSWSVDAYDEQGRKLSSSSSYYAAYTNQLPLFSLSAEGQLAGDRHVLARDWDEAIAAYRQEEHRQEAIRALGLIYAFGTDMEEEGRNAELAKSYLERLTDPAPFDQQTLASLEREAQPR